ncbi:MAG: hypothetical protein GXX96_13615 [Planctomycetaceae bacterium]|nr:hypothetical protein [Planctomycetaceae bacterium]
MANKKKTDTAQEVLHTIQKGQVVATVELRQSNAGFTYKQFVLSRKWQTRSSGKESSGNSFFEQHEADILETVKAACAYIRNGADRKADSLPVRGEEAAVVKTAPAESKGKNTDA